MQYIRVIPKGTILARGVAVPTNFQDDKSTYTVALTNRPEAHARKAVSFLSRYSTLGIEFYTTTRPLKLLYVPYSMTFNFDPQDTKYRRWVSSVYNHLINEMIHIDDINRRRKLIATLHDWLQMSEIGVSLSPNSNVSETFENPDYLIEQLVCSLGYAGWLRVDAEQPEINEVMICPRVRSLVLTPSPWSRIESRLPPTVREAIVNLSRSFIFQPKWDPKARLPRHFSDEEMEIMSNLDLIKLPSRSKTLKSSKSSKSSPVKKKRKIKTTK